ncbi:MAG: PilZ domain-containing protein [Lacunisphaera sp.]|nr:PilZ domain-containing protein [Lacunisphaera sp.]
MLFFKRILKEPEPDVGPEPGEAPPAVERRREQRFKVHPDSQLKAVLSFIGRDETGAQMSNSRAGWNWRGRVLDCSEQGVRLQMGPVVKAAAGDEGELTLEMEDFLLKVPCHIANISEQPGGLVFGLKHDIADEATGQAFRQLLDVVALGSTLRRKFKKNKVDASGYLTEQYASDWPARLTVWRNKEDLTVAAFEFLLKDSLLRGAEGRDLKFLAGTDPASARSATREKALEIYRLFRWVVPNMAPSVPVDVRNFLQHYAT